MAVTIESQNSPVIIGEKATITNYHGFCKGILKKYGYLLSPLLRKDINLIRAIGDSDIEKNPDLNAIMTTNEFQQLNDVDCIIKDLMFLMLKPYTYIMTL